MLLLLFLFRASHFVVIAIPIQGIAFVVIAIPIQGIALRY